MGLRRTWVSKALIPSIAERGLVRSRGRCRRRQGCGRGAAGLERGGRRKEGKTYRGVDFRCADDGEHFRR